MGSFLPGEEQRIRARLEKDLELAEYLFPKLDIRKKLSRDLEELPKNIFWRVRQVQIEHATDEYIFLVNFAKEARAESEELHRKYWGMMRIPLNRLFRRLKAKPSSIKLNRVSFYLKRAYIVENKIREELGITEEPLSL